MMEPRQTDAIIDARWVIPVEPAGVVLERHSLVITGERIADVLPREQAHARYRAQRTWTLDDHVLIPGLVNLHTHAAMTLMRGLADDLPLMEWLQKHIWPVELKLVNPEFVYDGTLLACAEMLRGGITCFNDMYFFPERSAAAALDAGMRASIGMILIDFPSSYASDAEDYLSKGLAVRDGFRGNPLLSFCMAPHAPYTVGDKSFTRMLTYARQLDVPIHIHLHETRDEIAGGIERSGVRPMERLRGLDLLGPGLIAVHMVHLTDAEIALAAREGCSVAHCPSSNLKLASGIPRVAAMLDAGINLGLGTDGTASNNRLDLFEEMRLAALLAKAESGRANALPARQALEMATLGGARALGLDREIGSLVPGKAADVAAVNLGTLELSPCYDPVSHLVYAAGREQVTHVWVNGSLRLEDRRLVSLNEATLGARAASWRERIAKVQQE